MKSSLLAIYLIANSIALNAQSKNFNISGRFDKPINGVIFLISEGIQEGYYLKNQIRDSAEITNGVFTLRLKGLENNLIAMNMVKPPVRYTLIDFWLSNCTRCLSEFSDLKIIYNQFKESGFSIIGISLDLKVDDPSRKNVVQQYQLNWIQDLDEGGIEARNLFVNQFPTNYLLNSNGEIVRKNISPFELKYFLLKSFSMEKPIFDKMEGFEPYN